MNPLKELEEKGQSIWLDFIRRNLLRSGELKRMVEEDGIRGVTSNPTIFEKAIAGSTDYDDELRALLADDPKIDIGKLYEALADRRYSGWPPMCCDRFLTPLMATTAMSAWKFRRTSRTTPKTPSAKQNA